MKNALPRAAVKFKIRFERDKIYEVPLFIFILIFLKGVGHFVTVAYFYDEIRRQFFIFISLTYNLYTYIIVPLRRGHFRIFDRKTDFRKTGP